MNKDDKNRHFVLLLIDILQLYHGEYKLIFNEMMMRSALYQTNTDNLYSASSLTQQSADRHAAPLGHIILIPSQPVFAHST